MNKPRTITVIAVLLGIILLSITVLETGRYRIEIECIANETLSSRYVIKTDAPLIMNYSFIHSVHKTPEHDILMINKTGFYLIEVWTQSFGAGVPVSPADVGGGELTFIGDYIVIKNIQKYMGTQMRIDIKNALNLTITINGMVFDKNYCPGTLVISIDN